MNANSTSPRYLHIAIAILLLICSNKVYCQKQTGFLKKLYVEFGAGIAGKGGSCSSWGVEAAFKNKIIVNFSKYNLTMKDKHLPANYTSSYSAPYSFWGINIPASYGAPPDVERNIYSLIAGKTILEEKKSWLSLQTGLSVVSGEKFNYTHTTPTTDIYGSTSSNYVVDREKKTVIGGVLKLEAKWAIARFVGVGFEAFGNINSLQSFAGIQVKLIAGKLW